MTNPRLEELLEELVSQNATIIDKLDDLISEVRQTNTEVESINGELNWIGKASFAQMVLERLAEIESAIRDAAL